MSSESGREAGEASRTFTRGGRTEETGTLPVSTVFAVLADERRRHLLYYLLGDAEGAAEASEIVDHLCRADPRAARADREAIRADLHHRHLPKMEDAGLLEYEGRDGLVRYQGDPLVEECLSRVAPQDLGGEP